MINQSTCSTRAVNPAMINRETTNAGHPPQQFLCKSKKFKVRHTGFKLTKCLLEWWQTNILYSNQMVQYIQFSSQIWRNNSIWINKSNDNFRMNTSAVYFWLNVFWHIQLQMKGTSKQRYIYGEPESYKEEFEIEEH